MQGLGRVEMDGNNQGCGQAGGVALSTASYAMSGDSKVSAKTREKFWQQQDS